MIRPWRYLAPALTLMAMWVYLPLVGIAGLSVTNWNLINDDRRFVGLDNYRNMAARPEFLTAARNTAVYTVGLVPFVVVAPMGIAILLWKHPGRGTSVYRMLLFLPVVIAPVVGALAWQWILHPRIGLANAVLSWFGVGPVNWLGSADTAIWCIVGITAWKLFGLSFILFAAGLSTVDRSYLEAASVDGASEWDMTRRIVVPLLTPTISMVSLLCLVFAGQWSFANINVLTQGGPTGSTDNLYHLLYTESFRYFDAGSSSVLAVILFAVFGTLSFAQWRYSSRITFHDA